MALDDPNDQFATRVAAAFAGILVDLVKQQPISRTVKSNLLVLLDDAITTAEVVAAPYWAGWYHEGRGVVLPRNGQVLIWFKDPELDPRKPTNVFRPGRKLTPQEFSAARKADLLIITTRSPLKGDGSTPHPFFTNAEPELFSRLDAVALTMVTTEVFRLMTEEQIRGLTGPFREAPATVRLKL